MRALVLLLAVAACGPSAKSLRTARESQYDVPFSTVWSVATEEVRRKYPTIKVEDPIRGRIETTWRVIEIGEGEGLTGAGADAFNQNRTGRAAPGQVTNMVVPAKLFRVWVQVRGQTRSGPWRIDIDGEAAEYQPGMAVLSPYKHGLPDEPPWVESRLASLTMAIHDRLAKHAVKVTVPREVIAEKVHDDTAWANLPDRAAVALIGKVHAAAVRKDVASLRPMMSEDFTFTAGADGSADTAVALWSADPSRLRALAETLEDGCAPEGADVVCPTKGEGNARATFRKAAEGWKFVGFHTAP